MVLQKYKFNIILDRAYLLYLDHFCKFTTIIINRLILILKIQIVYIFQTHYRAPIIFNI